MTMAISRHPSGDRVSAKLDDFGTDGVFALDGSVIHGTRGTISQDELAYRIWRQVQDPSIKESVLRTLWDRRNID
jgi:hypothetical protein